MIDPKLAQIDRLIKLRDAIDDVPPESLPYEQVKALYEIAIQLVRLQETAQ